MQADAGKKGRICSVLFCCRLCCGDVGMTILKNGFTQLPSLPAAPQPFPSGLILVEPVPAGMRWFLM